MAPRTQNIQTVVVAAGSVVVEAGEVGGRVRDADASYGVGVVIFQPRSIGAVTIGVDIADRNGAQTVYSQAIGVVVVEGIIAGQCDGCGELGIATCSVVVAVIQINAAAGSLALAIVIGGHIDERDGAPTRYIQTGQIVVVESGITEHGYTLRYSERAI